MQQTQYMCEPERDTDKQKLQSSIAQTKNIQDTKNVLDKELEACLKG